MSSSKARSAAAAGDAKTARPAVKPTQPAEKAVVLGTAKARGGHYQVLKPAVAPRHVSADKLARAVRSVIAAR